jgi:hypothetical protein
MLSFRRILDNLGSESIFDIQFLFTNCKVEWMIHILQLIFLQ